MKSLKVSQPERKALAIVTIIALIFGAYFLSGYFTLVVVAAITAYLFNPLYKRFVKRGMGPGKAAALTLIISFFSLIIPLGLVVFMSIIQIDSMVNTIYAKAATVDLSTAGDQLVNSINNFLNSLPFGDYSVSLDSLTKMLTDAVQEIGPKVADFLKGALPGAFGLITQSITYIFVFVSLLKNQDKIVSTLRTLNPIGTDVADLYLEKTAAMVKGAVKGQFTIAVVQGFTDAALIYLAGLHGAFFFFFVILTALSIIPLGGGILAIPVGIVMALTGNVWGGILVVGGHLLITTNEDNILRPRLVPKTARLDSALMLLSVFSGIAMFGFLGIAVGPVIMILIVTTIQVYLEVFKNIKAVDRSKSEKPPSLYSKVGGFTKKHLRIKSKSVEKT